MPIPLLDLTRQYAGLREEIAARVRTVMDSQRFILGPEVERFEDDVRQFSGASAAVGMSSGTDAQLAALMALGIGPGDAVFLPAFTYTATAEVPLVLGATPVFVDVDPGTLQMDMADLGCRIEGVRRDGSLRPRAVVGVDLFGQPAL